MSIKYLGQARAEEREIGERKGSYRFIMVYTFFFIKVYVSPTSFKSYVLCCNCFYWNQQ